MPDAPTPLEEAPPSLADGGPLFLKREDVHELGAFKWRGALPALEGFRDRGAGGVVTASTGNHGAASAWAADRLGMRAVVFVPEEASEAKVALLGELGAELHRVGSDLDESKELAREHAATNELAFFEDGAEPAQFDGYEAIGREILEQLGTSPARVIVPVGNGALIIGVARGVGTVLGVVAKEAPVMALSVEAGHPVESDRSGTFADGMAVRVAIPLAVEEMSRAGMPMMMVSEREIARAVGDYARAGIRAEGAAGSALAAFRELEPEHDPTVLIVTGRNIDDDLHRRAVEEPESFPD
ncbi:MAG: pyridoxal-phosphate dependent enzyme [Thermoleophilaceae bacterium]